MDAAKLFTFNLFFNYEGSEGRARAEKWRGDSLIYLRKLFENKARFSVITKDENTNGNKSTLLLRGFVNLNSPCAQVHMKRLLGKHSSCKRSYFGDVVCLCRLLHIDRDLVVTGKLPSSGNNAIKSFNGDPKLVIKILLDSIDRKDCSRGSRDEKDVEK